jgi:threonine dehydrogenase-like Zn-dependent dehydrogenase
LISGRHPDMTTPSIVQKGLRLCSGQTHAKRYLEPLTKLIQEKKVDTTFLITCRKQW